MKHLYELAVLGCPSEAHLADLKRAVSAAVKNFGLHLGQDVGWSVKPSEFQPNPQSASAAVFFGGDCDSQFDLQKLLNRAIPVLPVVTNPSRVGSEIPQIIQPLNCLPLTHGGVNRVATALLECVGLLPKHRRVFLSYRRNEASQAALQLFDALTARHFEVFLDTHSIGFGEDFQAALWHRLCDSDVLLMLDTESYFSSRWTEAEYGRALAKGIPILRVGWPDSTPSQMTGTASRAEIVEGELDRESGRLADEAVERICIQLEKERSKGHAVRIVNMVDGLRNAVEKINGRIVGVGAMRAVHIELPNGKRIVVYPTVGVPNSNTLHDAIKNTSDSVIAVVYDHVGVHKDWLDHLDWLGTHISSARWMKLSEAAWALAGWGVE